MSACICPDAPFARHPDCTVHPSTGGAAVLWKAAYAIRLHASTTVNRLVDLSRYVEAFAETETWSDTGSEWVHDAIGEGLIPPILDPVFALAVADMLDRFATDWEISGENPNRMNPVVRVARAYLGERP